jgi:hypothetical protein
MRLLRWACIGIFALLLNGAARAQNFQSGLTGVKPADVKFKPIDTGGAIAGVPPLTSAGQSSFSLSGMFRKLSGFGSRTFGSSSVPAQAPNIVTPRPPVNSTVNR